MADFRDVNPAGLHVPSSRRQGADPGKLWRQIAAYGLSIVGMPPLLVFECADGELELADGVTRATRVAKLIPGVFLRVEVIGRVNRTAFPVQVKDVLP